MQIRTFRALAVLLLVAGQVAAILAQNGPPSKDRYIIVLKPPKNGVPELSDHDITAGGGKVEYRVPGRIQVTLPEPAVEAMRKQERVKYIQKVILGPLPDASAPARLLMPPSTASLRPTAESTPPTWRSGTYKYDASGNIYAIGVAGDTGSPVQHRYAYDELSRLKRADTFTTPTHTETFTYDVYGNLTEHVDGSSTTSTPVEDPNTNRLAWSAGHPYTYDAAGNLTADYNASYAYDAIGMLREKDYTNEQPEYYIYTASDERIGVKYGTSSGSPTIWSIRDFSGNVLRQYEGHDQSPQMAWLWVEDYVYRDGQLLAAERVPEEGGRRHFHLDHLGSPRLVTSDDSKEMSDHDYEPFGLESNYQETAGGFDREDPKRFTGHERDYAAPGESPASTAYLDYMHARFYAPSVGRFLSVDSAAANLLKPQTWNRYAYGVNNPMKYVDRNGLEAVVFIIGSGSQASEAMGHAALWITSGNERRLVSYGGDQLMRNDPRGLVQHYRREGRTVKAFHLKTTPEQDAVMLAYAKQHAVDYGTDRTKEGAGLMLTENCTTAVCNVLKAGNVIKQNDNPARIFGYFDAPGALEYELEAGSLQGIVHYTNTYPPYEKRSEILDQFNRFLEGSWMFADAFGFEIQVKRP